MRVDVDDGEFSLLQIRYPDAQCWLWVKRSQCRIVWSVGSRLGSSRSRKHRETGEHSKGQMDKDQVICNRECDNKFLLFKCPDVRPMSGVKFR